MCDEFFRMDISLREEIYRYLNLFGLREGFSIEELNSAYRTLAKLNHPDVTGDKDDERMVLINEGYRVLKEALHQGVLDDLLGEHLDLRIEEDAFYLQYKKGFQILQRAFDDYYGEGEDKGFEGKLDLLRKRLLNAKIEFSRLVIDMPYNQWVDDAIDKISSINKWIE
jgi:curved DNA-binding protein CbpA